MFPNTQPEAPLAQLEAVPSPPTAVSWEKSPPPHHSLSFQAVVEQQYSLEELNRSITKSFQRETRVHERLIQKNLHTCKNKAFAEQFAELRGHSVGFTNQPRLRYKGKRLQIHVINTFSYSPENFGRDGKR